MSSVFSQRIFPRFQEVSVSGCNRNYGAWEGGRKKIRSFHDSRIIWIHIFCCVLPGNLDERGHVGGIVSTSIPGDDVETQEFLGFGHDICTLQCKST